MSAIPRMSLANVTRGRVPKPIIMTIYGVDGVGKSTFAAGSPNPIFLCTERGSDELDVARFPSISTKSELEDAIATLCEEAHDFQTLVLDSIDWSETLIRTDLCEQFKVDSLEDIRGGYGKGTVALREQFPKLLDSLSYLRSARNMHILIIGHCEVKKFEDPLQIQGYDRYRIKLDEVNAARLREWSDIVAFYNFDTVLTGKENRQTGEIQGRAKAKSFNKHEMFFRRSAAFDAKTRYNLPDKIVISKDEPPGASFAAFWNAYQAAIGAHSQAA